MRQKDEDTGLGDDQGTRIGRPDSAGATPANPTKASTGRSTGAGSEAAGGTQEAPIEGHDREHRSGYGGQGGRPDTSSDQRRER